MNAIKKFGMPGALLLVLALIVIGFVVLMGDDDSSETADKEESKELSVEEAPAPEIDIENEIQPVDGEEAPTNTEEAVLVAVNGYEGSGSATRSYGDIFIHEVIAQLDDPAEGKFYEGWLESGGEFISTGRLDDEGDGVWSLVYSQSEDASNLSNVVITEETEANGLDNIPEAHVLEGSF